MPELEAKTMSLTELIKEVVPYTVFSKLSIERQARDQLREGKDFILIYETQVITIPLGSIASYFSPSTPSVTSADEEEPEEEIAEVEKAVEFKEEGVGEDESKRKPGRPRTKA